MRMIAISALMAVVALAVAQNPPATGGQKEKKDEPKRPIDEVVKERTALHKRQTGALLTITAKWEMRKPGTGPGVVIDWGIDYDGPRRPFTVFTPVLSKRGVGQTTAYFWYPDADGKAAGFKLESDGEGFLPPIRKEDFSVAADGKPVAGRIVVGSGVRFTGRFGGPEPRPGEPRLWVQMEHAPTDRGDGYQNVRNPDTGLSERVLTFSLDAWTGQLWSPVVEVAVK